MATKELPNNILAFATRKSVKQPEDLLKLWLGKNCTYYHEHDSAAVYVFKVEGIDEDGFKEIEKGVMETYPGEALAMSKGPINFGAGTKCKDWLSSSEVRDIRLDLIDRHGEEVK